MNAKIFTDEQDSILRRNYPTRGAPWCLDEIGKQTGRWFSYTQIRNRIKRLDLTLAEGVKITPARNERQPPHWGEWPDNPYFVGPNPHIVGRYLIIEYLGYSARDRRTQKGYHAYKVRCLSCGRYFERQQTSITRAAEKNAKGCAACSKGNHITAQKTWATEHLKEREQAFSDWIDLMKMWPPTPVEFVPEEKRFDGR